MDWLSEWDPLPYTVIEAADTGADSGRLTAWLIVALAAAIIAALWYRQRIFRHSFWCATSRREVDVRVRRGRVLSCSAFENPMAIACDRRCVDRGFRMQWPAALPVLTRPQPTWLAGR